MTQVWIQMQRSYRTSWILTKPEGPSFAGIELNSAFNEVQIQMFNMRRSNGVQQSQGDLDVNGNVENPGSLLGLPPSRSFSNFMATQSSDSTMGMSSRPSFISLMLIASDDDFSRLPRLPAPLQVETDTYQKCGWEDEPKVCSHLPVLHPPSESEDESETHGGILQSIAHLPGRIRKISADKHRFNVYALPDGGREQLKNLYVY